MAYRSHLSYEGRVEAFLDDFVETASELPSEVRKLLNKVKDLDEKVVRALEQAETAAQGKVSRFRAKGKPHDGVNAIQNDIDDVQALVDELADRKIHHVQRLLELAGRASAHLDERLVEFEQFLRQEGKWPEGEMSAADTRPQKTEPLRLMSMRVGSVKESTPDDAASMETYDVPADPDEPRYCYCQQVSYGEMVGCDNDDCKYEWFHFQCVGLTAT
eukprot:CAMPEP_0198364418 /NCGR_PEP_ID=MMETSP1450-20131203/153369_1 /TAXON_ID=753684 ORGANISM="Madagascaria erythrocladiodes, Strain CCMP3234" /NCGR_SAMPLE_ID=MMETSP1450 /ASSEMBLY_ACC=CAM_ASM_001115 /LENGTH=216 /DNA_ID=CAMNT_0044071845 /DNA_START=75 /DNA_END=722 /DNA_ORIENTATION=+